MSDEIYFAIDLVSFLVAGLILAFGAYRALTFRRAFSNAVFQNRALWTAAVLLLWIVPNDTELFYYFQSGSSSSTIGPLLLLTFVTALGLVVASVGFVDGNVRVARELDFFHRDNLHWKRLRLGIYVAVPVVLILLPGGNSLEGIIGNITLAALLGYAVAALISSGLRVSDKLMRKHIMRAGIGLALLVATIAVPSPGPPGGIIYDALLLVGSYFLYLAVMSLSSLSRVEREVVATVEPGQSGSTLPSHP